MSKLISLALRKSQLLKELAGKLSVAQRKRKRDELADIETQLSGGEKDILEQEIADYKMGSGKTSESSYDEAERLVNTGIHETEPTKRGFSFYSDTKVDENFNPKLDAYKVGAVAGPGALGTGYAATEAMRRSGDAFSDDKHRKPDFTPKEKKDQQTKIDNAQETINDPNKPIDDNAGLKSLFAAPSYGNINIEKVQLAKYDDTENANQLKTELKNIGSKLESEINKLEDKQEAREQRIGIKSMFKTFIDAVATMYIAKHAPGAKYTAMTNPEEYHREISRLEANIQNARMDIVNKYKELKGEAKDEYKTKLSLGRDEVDAENKARMDYANKKFQFDKERLGQEFTAAQNKYLAQLKHILSQDPDAANKEDKPPLTKKQLIDENQQSGEKIEAIRNKIKSGKVETVEELKDNLLIAGFSKENADKISKQYKSDPHLLQFWGTDEIDPDRKNPKEMLAQILTQDRITYTTPGEAGVKKSGYSSKHQAAIDWLNSPEAAKDPEKAKKVLKKLESELGSK